MEERRDIEGYEGLYQVSNLGRVKSFYSDPPKILKPEPNKQGYLQVCLFKGGKPKMRRVHRLVAQAFIPNPLNKPEVNHKNGDKADNRASELEWCTRSENERHAFDTGLHVAKSGEEHSQAKLTNADTIYIRENPDNLNTLGIAEKFGVDNSIISRIQRGKTYKNAGGSIRGKQKQRVPDDQRAEIKRCYRQGGVSYRTLAKEFGCGKTTIKRIVHEDD